MKTIAILAAAAGLAAALFATPVLAGDIEVHHPWARASAGPARAGAAFMGIHNNAGAADRLVAASADVSKTVELHTHIKDGDVMRMRRVEGGIAVPAEGVVHLEPGGYHVMFMGLKAPLKEGETFPLTLTFENGGTMTVEVEVKGAGAMGPMHGPDHKHGDHHDHHMPKKTQ